MKNMRQTRSILFRSMTAVMAVLACTGIFGLITAPSKAKKAMDEIQVMLEEQQKQAAALAEERMQEAIKNAEALGPLKRSLATYTDASQVNVTVIGDSVTLAALDALTETFPNGYIDAVFGRTVYEGQNRLQELIDNDQLGQIAVFSIATNCEAYTEDFEWLVETCGDIPVFMVSVYGVQNGANDVMIDVCNRYRNAYFVDWETEALANRGEWILADGLHPNEEGSKYYAQCIHDAINNKVLIAAREARKQLVP